MTTRIENQHRQMVLAYVFVFVNNTLCGLVFAWLRYNNYQVGGVDALAFFGCALLVLFAVMNRRKYPMELTEEERLMPIEGRADFSNRLSWKTLMLLVLMLAYTWIVCLFIPLSLPYWQNDGISVMWSKACELFAYMPLAWWVLLVVAFVVPVFIMWMRSRNRYIIEGDTLVVREWSLFKQKEELRLPVGLINRLYIRNRWTLYPKLYIEVDGVTRELKADTHVFELAAELLRRRDALNLQ